MKNRINIVIVLKSISMFASFVINAIILAYITGFLLEQHPFILGIFIIIQSVTILGFHHALFNCERINNLE